MVQPFRHLLLALALTGGLNACGSKDKAAGQTAQAATAPTEAVAATTPAATDAAQPDTAKAATFDINTVPVTSAELGTFPYLGPLKDYTVNTSNSEAYDFERSYVYDGKNLMAVEGKVSQRLLDHGDRKASELMIQRNYEDLLKTLGATKVHSGKVERAAIDKLGNDEVYKHGKWVISTDHVTDTYVIRQKDKEVWVQVTALGGDGN
ncbi:MAG TPA: hypothetical protein VF630_13045, partial [Hymenobacter sp.]